MDPPAPAEEPAEFSRFPNDAGLLSVVRALFPLDGIPVVRRGDLAKIIAMQSCDCLPYAARPKTHLGGKRVARQASTVRPAGSGGGKQVARQASIVRPVGSGGGKRVARQAGM